MEPEPEGRWPVITGWPVTAGGYWLNGLWVPGATEITVAAGESGVLRAGTRTYSIGGGAVAPVPPFGPPGGRPQPFAASPVVFESDRPQDAADVVLSYFLQKTPEQPDHAYVRVHRQPDRVVTADTLEQWLRLRAQARTDTCHLHLAALRVGLAAADPGGVTFLVENVFVKAR